MDQPEENAPAGLNPYRPPADVGSPEIRLSPYSYEMPPLHWPRTIGIFAVLAIGSLVTYGTTLIFAFPILFGGIRTALIYHGCFKAARVPPSYILSTILSPISCFVFQIAAGMAFSFVCATRFSNPNPGVSEQAWLIISAIVGFAVYIGLYVGSIKVTIASCRRVT